MNIAILFLSDCLKKIWLPAAATQMRLQLCHSLVRSVRE